MPLLAISLECDTYKHITIQSQSDPNQFKSFHKGNLFTNWENTLHSDTNSISSYKAYLRAIKKEI
jgi:hypothetical protein